MCVEVDLPVDVLLVGVPFTTVTTTLFSVTMLMLGEADSSTPSEVISRGSEVVGVALVEGPVPPEELEEDAVPAVPLFAEEEPEEEDAGKAIVPSPSLPFASADELDDADAVRDEDQAEEVELEIGARVSPIEEDDVAPAPVRGFRYEQDLHMSATSQ